MGRLRRLTEDLLDGGLGVRLSVQGLSMAPVLRRGDHIIVHAAARPSVGDLVVVKRREDLICHRVRQIKKRGGATFYRTRGDNQFSSDEPVAEANILGTVTAVERGPVSRGRRLLLFCFPLLRYSRLNALLQWPYWQLRKRRVSITHCL